MIPSPEIETTADGSATLRSPMHGDTYHSLRGAVGEARHVFIEAGFLADSETKEAKPPLSRKILEMGFGTGLNAWLTLEEAAQRGWAVEYTAVELYPVQEEIASRLGYTDDPRFMALHTAPWGEWTEPSERFRLCKLQGAMAEVLAPSANPRQRQDFNPDADQRATVAEDLADSEFSANFDLVYWDAFAPDTQPELWTEEIFSHVFRATAPGGVLVTYSSKGDVRRALQAAGFAVERLPGALGKRHMLKATKNG